MKSIFHRRTYLFLLQWLCFATIANAGISQHFTDMESKIGLLADESEIVFIDSGVANFEDLAAEIGMNQPVFVLDKSRDGLQQMADVLVRYENISSLHIISHGSPGVLLLGDTDLAPANLSLQQSQKMDVIRKSLSETGDIFVYGCNFGSGVVGRKGVQSLAEVTKADISASTNVTGFSGYGGDWNLELHVGDIDSQALGAFSWHGVLIRCYENCQNIWSDSDGDGINICLDPCPNDSDNNCGVDLCPDDPNKVAPGGCGCGIPDTDRDHDHHPDCMDANPDTWGDINEDLTCSSDLCPNDPNKTAPGICGCGVVDTDSDGDGTADCNDNCPNDILKTELGTCGCGVADTDSDGDGTADCNDNCPNDILKTELGTCGCGVADTDSDGDGTVDCNDNCPTDMLKTEPGTCGCGVADTDSDGDGTVDCNDNCPNDILKTESGTCGCGVADTDSDGDGIADCNDNCPNDILKTEPGICGCGVADTDSDGDGTADCNDNCPNDILKTEPGTCGCGVADVDSDGDGIANCNDNCPNDMNKIEPGVCGCGSSDADQDGDGNPDCNDACPDDPNKTSPGVCGCGIFDADQDADGTADCNDSCPADANKTESGICGCGVADTDSDGDGTQDCIDGCPTDMSKVAPGTCGCGIPDTDTDGDGVLNCNDGCPNDSNKVEPGVCGCNAPDIDQDGDGNPDCNDTCVDDPNKNAPGICGCGVADTDTDSDGTPDCNDSCPEDALKIIPGLCGCGVADTDSDGNGIPDCQEQEGGDGPNRFPWILFIHNFHSIQPTCGETPTYCYVVADGDSDTSEDSPLMKYDFNTGSLDMIGRLGVGMVEAIALSLDGTTLYATDNGTLGIINTTPGSNNAFSPIKDGGIGTGNGSLGEKVFGDIDGLAFDPTSGILYGSERRADGDLQAGAAGVDLLVKIDHQTGEIIKDGFGQGVDYVVINTAAVGLFDTDDMTFDFDGNLYGIAAVSGGGGGDRLVVIDKQTGQVADRGELRSSTGPIQDMEGLTFYHGTSLYGTTGFEFSNQGTSNTLYQIDKENGQTSEVIRLDRNFDGLVPVDFEAIACPVCK